jgi:integrase
MHMTFGLLSVTLKNTYRRGNTIMYQRAVPSKLAGRYSGKTVKHDLKTSDLTVAEKAVALLNRRYEAEWAGLLAAPESSPASLKAHADAFLKDRGLRPGAPMGLSPADNHPMAVHLLHEEADGKRMRFAGGDDWLYRNAASEDYLTPIEIEAGKRLHGSTPKTLNDALELHLEIHPQRDDASFVQYQRRAFEGLIAITGDREIDSFKKADARKYLEATLPKVKTTTVRRRLGVLSAVFATYIRENDLTRTNPFAELSIPREGHDSIKRHPFAAQELAMLDTACKGKDDHMRWILAMLAGTGARLAEIVGLPLEDIVVDEDIPHVILQVHPWRDIKGAKGIRGVKDRTVPLVGYALWAAKRVKAEAKPGERFAFPQYTDATGCKATSASAALNGWIRRLPLSHTCHDLRHTVKDQLRAVQCPKEISDAITGHGKKDTGDSYGDGYPLEVKAEWLDKAIG